MPLAAISAAWPPAIRGELPSSPNASVEVPISRLDAGMKAGKLAFPWGDLSQWITPAPPAVSPQNRQTMVEIPLSVAAPLYLTRMRPSASQRKVEIPENIPGVFTGAPGQAPQAPVVEPVEAPPEPVAEPAAGSTLGQLLGQPDKADWPPQDVAQYLCMLEGIAGSLLASSDGLTVSGQMPNTINSELLSAFVPQMFGRMSQSAEEMQLGPVTSVVITAGGAPYAIYRAGTLYLVVLGEAGKSLPESRLLQIAAELAVTNQ